MGITFIVDREYLLPGPPPARATRRVNEKELHAKLNSAFDARHRRPWSSCLPAEERRKPLAEDGNYVQDAPSIQRRCPHFDDVGSTRECRIGDLQTQIQGPHIHRNLKREAGLEAIQNAGPLTVFLLSDGFTQA